MAECEICGTEAQLYLVEIDRAKLRVCRDCSKSGRVLESPHIESKPRKSEKPPQRKQHATEFEIVPDYGTRIRNARSRMQIPRNVLAEMINEKESFLERVESEKTLPPEPLAKKLEKALGISLFEEAGVESGGFSSNQQKGLTLGDIIKIKKRGRQDGN